MAYTGFSGLTAQSHPNICRLKKLKHHNQIFTLTPNRNYFKNVFYINTFTSMFLEALQRLKKVDVITGASSKNG